MALYKALWLFSYAAPACHSLQFAGQPQPMSQQTYTASKTIRQSLISKANSFASPHRLVVGLLMSYIINSVRLPVLKLLHDSKTERAIHN